MDINPISLVQISHPACVFVCVIKKPQQRWGQGQVWAVATQELKNEEENINPMRPYSTKFSLKSCR